MDGDEFKLIETLRRQLEQPTGGVIVGIGDDAAVLEPPAGKLLAAMDIMVEDVHFDRSLITPFQLGAKALAVNISDIAAMGGSPHYALVTLGVPSGIDSTYLEAIYRGMNSMAVRFGVQVVGGDVTSSPGGLLVDICLLGSARWPLLRSGARPGQLLVVTGSLGDSAAGLIYLLSHRAELQEIFQNIEPVWPQRLPEAIIHVIRRHLEPFPQVAAAQSMLEIGGIGALQDISDGLASEVNHIARRSGVGAVLWADSLPISREMLQVAELLGHDPLDWALYGGEDYQLLASIDRESEEKLAATLQQIGVGLTIVGEVKETPEIWLQKQGQQYTLQPRGYNHFRN